MESENHHLPIIIIIYPGKNHQWILVKFVEEHDVYSYRISP